MEFPSFSVAISVYKSDDALFFDKALESVTIKQTIMPDEIVLVVDGPVSGEIDDVIDKYSLICAMKVIRLKENGGLGNALRIATENSSYSMIARMDSDDISVPDRFEQQLRFFLQNKDVDIVGGNIAEFIGEETNIVATRSVPTSNGAIREYMKRRCAMNHVSVMFKKNAVMQAGGYLDWFHNEDYYLWIRMWLNNTVFANTGTNLVNVRVGEDMYARRGGLKYYKSEKKLQKFMLQNRIIGFPTYFVNVAKRFIVQVLLPNRLRGWVFKKLARS